MKRVLVAVVLSIGLAAGAQAAQTYTFTFDYPSLHDGDHVSDVQSYMDGIVVDGGTLDDTGSNDRWLQADKTSGTEGLKITFNHGILIKTVTFDWASHDDAFVAGGGSATSTSSFFSHGSTGDSTNSGLGVSHDFDGSPVSTLYFHDSGDGWVGIDQLLVTTADSTPSVPAPAAVLLAGLGTGLVGWIKRRRAL